MGLFDDIESLKKEDKERMANENFIIGKRGRKFKEEIVHFDVKETDSELVVYAKELINKHQVTNKAVYEYFGDSQGYNMIYSLKKKKTAISWERLRLWGDFLGLNIEIVTSVKENSEDSED